MAEQLATVRADVLLATDEEGGDVTRLDYLVGSGYPGNLALGHVDEVGRTAAVASAIGAELRSVGVNVNLAPSVDVNSDPRNPVIGVRSFGQDPKLVARHGAAFVRGLQAAGVAATAKHFPGHGATVVDSHLGLPVVDVDEQTFRRRELPPFAAAIAAGVELVMSSHVVFPVLDSEPATHSRRLLGDLLRGELGFDGVVITDALDMAGALGQGGLPAAAVRALAAGSDLLLLGARDGKELRTEIHAAVSEALHSGVLSLERLHQAGERVAALRRRVGGTGGAAGPDPDVGVSAADAAVTVRGDVALRAPAVLVELRSPANMAVGEAPWGLTEPLSAVGMHAATVTVQEEGPGPETVETGAAPVVLVVRGARRSAWQRAWVEQFVRRVPDAVLVALGMPEDGELTPGPAVWARGAGRVNVEAAVARLAPR
ncbi:hypothetical protein M3148_04575 [Georgenia satyanarayanai]|uniref:glycoside hydrolase family 3 protein n=1 Tax=Georgenia satyanarayanai TaxID=860221 RepID=UPI00203A9B0A|nr:glycoside hydrolase family 3 N-terminal domain-containing protein [Georgenia satyanarayanai]MCM3660272.1 hypothetical protein [Georgenia satyanarayanai]